MRSAQFTPLQASDRVYRHENWHWFKVTRYFLLENLVNYMVGTYSDTANKKLFCFCMGGYPDVNSNERQLLPATLALSCSYVENNAVAMKTNAITTMADLQSPNNFFLSINGEIMSARLPFCQDVYCKYSLVTGPDWVLASVSYWRMSHFFNEDLLRG